MKALGIFVALTIQRASNVASQSSGVSLRISSSLNIKEWNLLPCLLNPLASHSLWLGCYNNILELHMILKSFSLSLILYFWLSIYRILERTGFLLAPPEGFGLWSWPLYVLWASNLWFTKSIQTYWFILGKGYLVVQGRQWVPCGPR